MLDEERELENLRQSPLAFGSRYGAVMCTKVLKCLHAESELLSAELEMDQHKVLYLLVQLWASSNGD